MNAKKAGHALWLFALAPTLGFLCLFSGCFTTPRSNLVAQPSNATDDASCEEGSGGRAGYTYVSGPGSLRQKTEYVVRDGMAIVEGDIILGTVEEMDRARIAVEKNSSDIGILGVVIKPDLYRWANKTIYYKIAADLPQKDRVTNAIKAWETNTSLKFVLATAQPNFVTFRRSTNGCSADVGMKGKTFVNIDDGCSKGSVIHEIGHTIGFWHEQSRSNRNQHVEIMFANIHETNRHNFNIHSNDGMDIGDYDFGSIMHYPTNAFAIDKTKPTIVPKGIPPRGVIIGQRNLPSASDVATVKKIYP